MSKTIRIACKGSSVKDLSDLNDYQGTLKKLNAKGGLKLRKEILELGFSEPISVWEHEGRSHILNGHQRVAVLRQMAGEGYRIPALPVCVVEAASHSEAKRKVLALTSQYGTMTQEGLSEFLSDAEISLQEAMDSFQFPEVDMAAMLGEGEVAQDSVPERPVEPITEPGELTVLGRHRLLCGDSTAPEDVLRVMDGKRAVLFATDPPYLVDYDGTNHPHKWNKPDANKDWSESYGRRWDEAASNPDLYERFVSVALEHAIEPNAAWYCWHASRNQAMLEDVWTRHGAFVHQQIVWAKDRPILTRSWYMWQHEPCFFGWVRGNKPQRVAPDYPRTVWNLPTVKCGQGTDHPTSKPVEVFAIPMRQHTRPGEVCYEPFAGSGSQYIAGEQLGRAVYGLELEPTYCDVIVRRYWALLGWDKASVEHRRRWMPEAREVTSHG